MPTNQIYYEQKVFKPETVQAFESDYFAKNKLKDIELMQKAGDFMWRSLWQHWPMCRRIVICCGKGNNAGDGYILAERAKALGYDVEVLSLVESEKLSGAAKKAYDMACAAGIKPLVNPASQWDFNNLNDSVVLVDALLGIGFKGVLNSEYKLAVNWINQHRSKVMGVLSLDVPAGLNPQTGFISDNSPAVRACLTATVLAIKSGLVTGQAFEYTGILKFNDLGVKYLKDLNILSNDYPAVAKLIAPKAIIKQWPIKPNCGHKYQLGSVLVIGGGERYPGAPWLSALSAQAMGASAVTVLTHSCHKHMSICAPEIMYCPHDDNDFISQAWRRAHVVIIGPGLGRDDWAKKQFLLMLKLIKQEPKRLIIDADGLFFLKKFLSDINNKDFNFIITPHAGEAKMLLPEISQCRYAAIQSLTQYFGAITVLKGPGTLLSDGSQTEVLPIASAYLATVGSGDVLAGVIAAAWAQLDNSQAYMAAKLGICAHGLAGEYLDTQALLGTSAFDIIHAMRKFII
jgi:NAD(P)H-hydrate epimerase